MATETDDDFALTRYCAEKRGSCEYRTFGGNEQRSGTGICPWRKIDDTCI